MNIIPDQLDGKKVILTSGKKQGFVEGTASLVGDEIYIYYGEEPYEYSKVTFDDINIGNFNLKIVN